MRADWQRLDPQKRHVQTDIVKLGSGRIIDDDTLANAKSTLPIRWDVTEMRNDAEDRNHSKGFICVDQAVGPAKKLLLPDARRLTHPAHHDHVPLPDEREGDTAEKQ